MSPNFPHPRWRRLNDSFSHPPWRRLTTLSPIPGDVGWTTLSPIPGDVGWTTLSPSPVTLINDSFPHPRWRRLNDSFYFICYRFLMDCVMCICVVATTPTTTTSTTSSSTTEASTTTVTTVAVESSSISNVAAAALANHNQTIRTVHVSWCVFWNFNFLTDCTSMFSWKLKVTEICTPHILMYSDKSVKLKSGSFCSSWATKSTSAMDISILPISMTTCDDLLV